MIQFKKKDATVYTITIYALLSIGFPLTTYAYKVFINDTGKHVNREIAREYAWIRLQEFDFVNNKNDLKRYDKNQYVIIVRNKRHTPNEAHVFVFFPLKQDKKYEVSKEKEYALSVLDFVKDGYMFPNLSGDSLMSIAERVDRIVYEGLGPDLPIDMDGYDPDQHDPRIQIKNPLSKP